MIKCLCTCAAAVFVYGANAGNLKLWYASPGANGKYGDAMMIGNGRMGGMTAGRVTDDQIFLDDSSLWTGTANPSGKYDTSDPAGFGSYQYFGTLNVDLGGQSSFTNYRRELDLSDAIARVRYSVGSTNYSREYFCSHPDDVMVIHLAAGSPGAYTGSFSYHDSHGAEVHYTSTNITAEGTLSGSGIQWAVHIRVINTGGTLSTAADRINFNCCDSLTVIVSAGTSYVMNPAVNFRGPDPSNHIAALAAGAAAKNYAALKDAHLADYHRLFDRVTLNLGGSSAAQDALPTDRRIAEAARTLDPELEVLMFQNARYLLIANSRPGGLPPNLQGLWSKDNKPPWASDYHTDINIQMMQWLEPLNLPECHQPLLDFINSQLPLWHQRNGDLDARMRPNGIPRGWTVRVSHNITGGMGWLWNTPGNAWYCLHYWEHFQFTGDTNFLATNAYPVMKEVCEFWQDCLVTNADGKLVAPYCWSPEHGGWEDGVSYNQELIWNLFDNYIQASSILNIDAAYRATITRLRDSLLKPKIGHWGQLQEWAKDIDDPTDHHRHTMHLVGVYPCAEITPDKTPALANAAKVSLIARGETGDSAAEWANVWRTAIWARLDDGESAYHRLSLLFADHEAENNFVMHLPPEQWDGTYGIAAAMSEMLLQSHEGFINLLPALPSEWPSGAVTGLRARGGFTVDIAWTNGWLTGATIRGAVGSRCVVRYGTQTRTFKISRNGSAHFVPAALGKPLPPDFASLNTIAGVNTLTWHSPNVGLCSYNIKYASRPNGPYWPLTNSIRGTHFQTPLSATNYFIVTVVRRGRESADSRPVTGSGQAH